MTLFKSKCLLLLVVAACSLMKAYAQEKRKLPEEPLTWSEFISAEGSFRVEMPDRPKVEVTTYESGTARLVHNIFTVEKGGFIWMIDYSDLPDTLDAVSASTFLDELREELVKDSRGTLKQQKPLTLDGHTGSEITFSTPGGEIRVRFYLVGRRLYQLFVSRIDLLSTSTAKMEKFLDSFKLIKSPTPTARQQPLPETRLPAILNVMGEKRGRRNSPWQAL